MKPAGPSVADAGDFLDALGSSGDPVVFQEHPDEHNSSPADAEMLYHALDRADEVPLEYYAAPRGRRRTRLVVGTLAGMVLDRVADAAGCGIARARRLLDMAGSLDEEEYVDAADVAARHGVSRAAARRGLRDLARIGLARKARRPREGRYRAIAR